MGGTRVNLEQTQSKVATEPLPSWGPLSGGRIKGLHNPCYRGIPKAERKWLGEGNTGAKVAKAAPFAHRAKTPPHVHFDAFVGTTRCWLGYTEDNRHVIGHLQ